MTVTLAAVLLPASGASAQDLKPEDYRGCDYRPQQTDPCAGGLRLGPCCFPSNLGEILRVSFRSEDTRVGVRITRSAPPSARYWFAEWDNDRAQAAVTTLENGEYRWSNRRHVAAIVAEGTTTAEAVLGFFSRGGEGPRTYLLGQASRSAPRCTEQPQTLQPYIDRLNACRSEVRDAERARNECEQARKVLEEKRKGELDEAEKRFNTAVDSHKEAIKKLESDRDDKVKALIAESESKTENLRRQLRPSWLKWTALAVAIAATGWTAWEVRDFLSANNAYSNAPPWSPDLGQRHVDVVEAKGRLTAAGAAFVLGWALYASLVVDW